MKTLLLKYTSELPCRFILENETSHLKLPSVSIDKTVYLSLFKFVKATKGIPLSFKNSYTSFLTDRATFCIKTENKMLKLLISISKSETFEVISN